MCDLYFQEQQGRFLYSTRLIFFKNSTHLTILLSDTFTVLGNIHSIFIIVIPRPLYS